jgi:hypothetical protein
MSAVPYTFATDTGNIPLSQLDANFANVKAKADTAVVVTANAQPNITSVGTLSSLSVSGNITGNFIIGNGSLLTNLPGANITGTVANATYALNANNSIFAGTVTTNAQPNITSVGTLSSLTVTGNINSGNANLGNLVTANFFSGDGSLLTSLTGANVTGQVANALIAGTVYTNAQPNITSVGTLSSLTVTANVTGGNLLTGGLISATANITGGNILTTGIMSSTGNATHGNLTVGSGNVNVGNVVFALDNSKFNSAKWTLVETFANIDFNPSATRYATMGNTIGYYVTNYNELTVLYNKNGANNFMQTILPTAAIVAPSNYIIGGSDTVGSGAYAIGWLNLSSGNTRLTSGSGVADISTIKIYAR